MSDKKTFVATTEERYVWDCPYCGGICDECYEDIDGQEVVCEHCGKIAICEGIER